MKKIIIICALLVARPASACHIYKYWHFHHPQRCATIKFVSLPKLSESPIDIKIIPPKEIPNRELCMRDDYDFRAFGLCLMRYELKTYYENKTE